MEIKWKGKIRKEREGNERKEGQERKAKEPGGQ